MKYLITLLVLLSFNMLKADDNILKLLIKERIELYGNDSKIVYKVSDENNLVTLYYTDSVKINLKINEIYCYYDLNSKQVLSKDVYENTWFNRENKTNKIIFSMIMSDPEIWEIKTDTVICKKIKKNFSVKNGYKYKILTSKNTIEYSNKKFDINEILYYTNSEGLVSESTHKEILNKLIKTYEK